MLCVFGVGFDFDASLEFDFELAFGLGFDVGFALDLGFDSISVRGGRKHID